MPTIPSNIAAALKTAQTHNDGAFVVVQLARTENDHVLAVGWSEKADQAKALWRYYSVGQPDMRELPAAPTDKVLTAYTGDRAISAHAFKTSDRDVRRRWGVRLYEWIVTHG